MINIREAKLVKMFFDYEKIEMYNGQIEMEGTVQISTPKEIKDKSIIKVSINFKKEDDSEELFNLVYRFLVDIDNENVSEEEIDNQLKNFAVNDAQERVNEFLNDFYKIANIKFIELGSFNK